MGTVSIIVEVEDGLATVVDVAAPPGVTVRIILRDYDTNGSGPEELEANENGRPCFEAVSEYIDRG